MTKAVVFSIHKKLNNQFCKLVLFNFVKCNWTNKNIKRRKKLIKFVHYFITKCTSIVFVLFESFTYAALVIFGMELYSSEHYWSLRGIYNETHVKSVVLSRFWNSRDTEISLSSRQQFIIAMHE